ncbi:MAG: protein phosphatase 2C domain-containing protein [Bryobacterales bacterium]|nr:protein phosphatase 2C domain-containing protein [Bryobacterales bacterium]
MRVTAHTFTHIGQRDENQDRLSVLHSSDGSSCLVVVADGLGGHAGGALAAQTACETAEQIWHDRRGHVNPEEFLKTLALACHEAVNEAGERFGKEPRTTLAALLIERSGATTVHAGDSRVMQFSGDRLVSRTIDHSIGQLSVLQGKITESELATHPDQKKLFSHLGGESIPDLEFKHWKLAEGRRFVVCSDGFWEVFPPEQIPELFEASDPEREICNRFLKKLEISDNHDNTTAVLVDIGRELSSLWYWSALVLLVLSGLLVALVPCDELKNRRNCQAS